MQEHLKALVQLLHIYWTDWHKCNKTNEWYKNVEWWAVKSATWLWYLVCPVLAEIETNNSSFLFRKLTWVFTPALCLLGVLTTRAALWRFQSSRACHWQFGGPPNVRTYACLCTLSNESNNWVISSFFPKLSYTNCWIIIIPFVVDFIFLTLDLGISRSLSKCHGQACPGSIGGRGYVWDELHRVHWEPGRRGLLRAHPITGGPGEQRENNHDAEPRQRPAARRGYRPQQEVRTYPHVNINARFT